MFKVSALICALVASGVSIASADTPPASSKRETPKTGPTSPNEPAPPEIGEEETREPKDGLKPPELIERRDPAFPSALQSRGVLFGEVTVTINIDESGRISGTTLDAADDPAFFAALEQTLPHWRFKPATLQGEPVETRMQVKWVFKAEAPEVPESVPETPKLSQLRGRVFSRGVRRPVPGVIIRFEPGNLEAFTDAEGRFTLDAPANTYTVRIDDSEYRPFREQIRIKGESTDAGEWLLTPEGFDDQSVVVIGRRPRETQRITLDRFELSHVPGTMGDPLRVIQSLPGVGSVASFVPFPIVRGAPPGETGYFIDETSIPLLFHLGDGTSVIHPQLIDSVHFYPGVAPVQYGRFVGGAVEAQTRLSDKDIWIGDLDINLFQSGAMLSAPFNDGRTRVTVGGRYSYTGLLLTLMSQNAYLNFWDYVTRVQHRFGNDHRLKVTLFGAQDEMGDGRNEENRIFVDFHRAAVRYTIPTGDHRLTIGLDLGADRLDTPASRDEGEAIEDSNGLNNLEAEEEQAAALREYSIRPLVRWTTELSESLSLEAGADLEVRPVVNRTREDDAEEPIRARPEDFISPPETKYVYGLYHAVNLKLDRWLLTPSVRADYYENIDKLGLDPRFGARYALNEMTTLKGHVGLAHAQQRFYVPIPGLGDLELQSPLQESWQATVGIEHNFGGGFSLDANMYGAYRRHMTATVFETDENGEIVKDTSQGPAPFEDVEETFEIPVQNGRAFGAEVIFRKRRTAQVFGWLAYTLQRVERKLGEDWIIDPLDQTHIVNLVVSWRFAPDYIWGVRFHYNTGRPIRETNERLDGYFQIDTRFDILTVADTYQVDFYIDVINLTYEPEQLSEDGDPVRFILPTIGAHGTF